MRHAIVFLIAVIVGSTCHAAPANDPSGPRAALLAYDKIVGPGEADKAMGIYRVTAVRERVVAELLAKVDGALATLQKAAKDKYGAEIADAMVKSVGGKGAADINAATIKVEGDSATVQFPGDEEAMVMVKAGGEWKISVKDMIRGIDDLPRFRKGLGQLAAEVAQIAEDIGRSRFASAEIPSKKLLEAKERAFKKGE